MLGLLVCFGVLNGTALAQSKKNARGVDKTAVPVAPQPAATPEITEKRPEKKNGRPADHTVDRQKAANTSPVAFVPVYTYEFTRPGFSYSRILIEHDDAGKGRISFVKDGSDELITDPIDLSAATLARIRSILAALNFLDSTENYQTDRDYSQLGNITFKVKKDGRERSVKYNWTSNKDAKDLMDEYAAIGNEYTWAFEIRAARENQPLLTPSIMEAIDTYIDRKEISDPPHLIPFLTELSNDERLPLMARNRAQKLIRQIQKGKK